MDTTGSNNTNQSEFINLLKKIDEDNYLYVMPIIEEQKITIKQFHSFDRHYLQKLFDMDNSSQTRELGREVQFIEKFIKWKNAEYGQPKSSEKFVEIPGGNNINYTLNDVMDKSAKGCEIKIFYEKNGRLGSSEQNLLSREIVDFFVSKNIKLTTKDMQNVASQIVAMFPTESAELYFKRNAQKRATGKLFHRFNNAMKSSHKSKCTSEHVEQHLQKCVVFVGNESDARKTKMFLKYNFTDKAETCNKWKSCAEFRLQEILGCKDANIENIIANWPAYKQHFGPDLINVDFEILFPEKSYNFYVNWEKLKTKLPSYIDINLKDARLKSIWSEAQENWEKLDHNSKDATFIYVLHGILKPTKIIKDVGKPTIADSQQAVLKFITTDVEANLYEGNPPFILVKNKLFSIEKIWVVTDQIIYKVDYIATALALTFKIHQIFNLTYNSKCVNFWLFVQKSIFDINLKSDIVSNNVNALTSFFKSN